MIFKKIKKEDGDLKIFISNLGNSSKTFTYFNERKLSCLKNHILTILLYENDEPIGYGHLDKEGETVWLGICVIESKTKLGYGKKIMNYLTKYADKNKINLKLSVHKFNIKAVNLYKKFNFIKISESDKSLYFARSYLNN